MRTPILALLALVFVAACGAEPEPTDPTAARELATASALEEEPAPTVCPALVAELPERVYLSSGVAAELLSVPVDCPGSSLIRASVQLETEGEASGALVFVITSSDGAERLRRANVPYVGGGFATALVIDLAAGDVVTLSLVAHLESGRGHVDRAHLAIAQ